MQDQFFETRQQAKVRTIICERYRLYKSGLIRESTGCFGGSQALKKQKHRSVSTHVWHEKARGMHAPFLQLGVAHVGNDHVWVEIGPVDREDYIKAAVSKSAKRMAEHTHTNRLANHTQTQDKHKYNR